MQPQFGQQLPAAAINRPRVAGKTKAAAIPAVAQSDRQRTGTLQLFGYIKGLVLHLGIVGAAIGGQHFAADLSAVPGRLIQPQAADIQPGFFDRPARSNRFGKNGVAGFGLVAADPLRLPGLVLFGGLEPVFGARRFLIGIRAHRYGPGIAGAGRKGHLHRCAQAVQIGPAGVCRNVRAVFHKDAGSRLSLTGRILHLPGKDRLSDGVAQRVGQVVGLAMGDLHLA